MTKFKVGDQVLCVNNAPLKEFQQTKKKALTEGKMYLVREVDGGPVTGYIIKVMNDYNDEETFTGKRFVPACRLALALYAERSESDDQREER